MLFKATARQYNDTVEFEIEADDVKQARIDAKKEARRIFDYTGVGDDPGVYLRQAKVKGE